MNPYHESSPYMTKVEARATVSRYAAAEQEALTEKDWDAYCSALHQIGEAERAFEVASSVFEMMPNEANLARYAWEALSQKLANLLRQLLSSWKPIEKEGDFLAITAIFEAEQEECKSALSTLDMLRAKGDSVLWKFTALRVLTRCRKVDSAIELCNEIVDNTDSPPFLIALAIRTALVRGWKQSMSFAIDRFEGQARYPSIIEIIKLRNAIESGDRKSIQKNIENIQTVDLSNFDSYFVAESFHSIKRWRLAKKYFVASLKDEETRIGSLSYLSDIAIRLCQPLRARVLAELVLTVSQDDPLAMSVLFRSYLLTGQFRKAFVTLTNFRKLRGSERTGVTPS